MGVTQLGYETGAVKYFLWTLVYPVNYYFFGGGILWFWDVLDLLRADSVHELALSYLLMEYGIPSSLEQVVVQTLVGGAVATIFWYVAVKR